VEFAVLDGRVNSNSVKEYLYFAIVGIIWFVSRGNIRTFHPPSFGGPTYAKELVTCSI